MSGDTAFARGLWRLADPKISLGSWESMALGAMAAAACRTTLRGPNTTAALVPAQRHGLRAFVLHAVGVGLGLLAE